MRTVARDLTEAAQAIREERPFRLRGSGKPSLWATTELPGSFGRIPAQHSVGAEAADYWVFSYETLIAWKTEGEPTVPDVGYSPTTGQHQHLVAAAWGLDFRPARRRDTVGIPRNDSLYGRARRLRRGGMDGARPVGLRDGVTAQDVQEHLQALFRAGRETCQGGPLDGYARPHDPHGYTYPSTDWMRADYSGQDDLMDEIWGGKLPSHP